MSIHTRWSSGNLVYQERSGYGCVQVGEYASLLKGSGLAVSTNRTAAHRVYADDGGVALPAGAYRAAMARALLTVACAAADISVYGHQSQLRVNADYSLATGILGGEWAYLELVSGGKVNVGGALVAHVDIPSGAYSIAHVAGLLVKSNDLGGTHTGNVSVIYVPNPGAGTFDAFLDLGSATGATQANAAGAGGNLYLKVFINNVLHTIACAHA